MSKLTVLHGNCLEKLRELPEQSVHCVITSPPYWGLRDYQIPPSIWGGEPDCDHEWEGEEGRSAVLIEIAEHYLPLIQKRCGVTAGLAL